MSTKLDVIESKLQTRAEVVIEKLSAKLGIEVTIYKRTEDDYSDVYGVQAGPAVKGSPAITKHVIITGDGWTSFDAFSISTFQEGYVYDPDGDIGVGDMIEISRAEGQVRQFQVMEDTGIGSTRIVLNRFRLVALSE